MGFLQVPARLAVSAATAEPAALGQTGGRDVLLSLLAPGSSSVLPHLAFNASYLRQKSCGGLCGLKPAPCNTPVGFFFSAGVVRPLPTGF